MSAGLQAAWYASQSSGQKASGNSARERARAEPTHLENTAGLLLPIL